MEWATGARLNNQERLSFTMELRVANIDHVYIAARASLAGNSLNL
jgi:hypothetical protein